jgi:hypothetical protein
MHPYHITTLLETGTGVKVCDATILIKVPKLTTKIFSSGLLLVVRQELTGSPFTKII